ncbi:MAG: phosphate ABC transporter permease PstA, partial [Ignavibacteriales bacterium]|nr:phosphate ABC transporter permease PstA [Ignavibacteriales bacterium]
MKQHIPRGDGFIWLTGAFLALSILMITGMITLIAVNGIEYFRPRPIDLFTVRGEDNEQQTVLGQAYTSEEIPADVAMTMGVEVGTRVTRYLVRVGTREMVPQDFRWINGPHIVSKVRPPDAVCIERLEYGHAFGFIESLRIGETRIIDNEVDAWDALEGIQAEVRDLTGRIRRIEKSEIGRLNYRMEQFRLETKTLEYRLRTGTISGAEFDARKAYILAAMAELESDFRSYEATIESLRSRALASVLQLRIVGDSGSEETIGVPIAAIVRAYKPNVMSVGQKAVFYAAKFWEFVSEDPREANAEGGVFPAIFGTVMMVLLMTVVAVPFGVLAALYLREYTSGGAMVRTVRIAVNNLAGVPSIVFGMFGLGFFVYFVGGGIDALLYPERLPSPTYGTGGILWASLTLALLTVPVVIVATEEALAAIPRGMREGSLALGATKWETIRRVVLPSATPGIMTGAILAMARGAGEVAPLMITGVVKLATEMPFDQHFPFFHFDRKFMHLGFHIYDVGFQTSNVEANIGMVYT